MDTVKKRNTWTMKIQKKFALDIYNEIWPGCTIIEVDELNFMKKNELARILDYDGLDKIIIQKTGRMIHMAQRFRQYNPYGDFSLRYYTFSEKYGKTKSEYFKLKRSINTTNDIFWYPRLYAFGITTKDETAFREFHFIKTKPMMEALILKQIPFGGPKMNHDGKSSFIFINMEDLKPFIMKTLDDSYPWINPE